MFDSRQVRIVFLKRKETSGLSPGITLAFCLEILLTMLHRGKTQTGHNGFAQLKRQTLEFEEVKATDIVNQRIREYTESWFQKSSEWGGFFESVAEYKGCKFRVQLHESGKSNNLDNSQSSNRVEGLDFWRPQKEPVSVVGIFQPKKQATLKPEKY